MLKSMCAVLALSTAAMGDVLWDTGGWDRRDGRASDTTDDGSRAPARSADDVVLPAGNGNKYQLSAISGEMLAIDYTSFSAEIFADAGGVPGNSPILVLPASAPVVLETGVFGLYDRVRVTVPTGAVLLQPGRYWVSLVGLVDGESSGAAFMGTAGNGVLQGSEGYYRVGSGDWRRSFFAFGFSTDFSLKVEGFQTDGSCPEDCNNNTICDDEELGENDCNTNGVPDDCDIALGDELDCDDDGVPDSCSGRCAPDLAAPFGVLNVFDFLAFQNFFGAGSLCADLGPPFGLLNVFDFLAFQASFGNGC